MKDVTRMKPLHCIFGLHYPWHEHTVHSPAYPNGAPDGYSAPNVIRDRVCLGCGHETREASRLYARDKARRDRAAAAEQRLRKRL